MDATAVMITAAIAIPVTGLSAWLLIALARIDRKFRSDIEGIRFDV